MYGQHVMPNGQMMANDQTMGQQQGNPLLELLGMGGQSAQPTISPIELLKMLLMLQRQGEAPAAVPGAGPAIQQMMQSPQQSPAQGY